MSTTREVVREKARVEHDLIKNHPLISYATSPSYNPHVKRLLLFFPLRGEGETVWKRETWRENRATRKEDRYPALGGRKSRRLEDRLFA
jgi:hypothetical protein